MKYINGIGYMDESSYYKVPSQSSADSSVFDSVFEAETIIYATPESSGVQSGTPGNDSSCPVTSPAELDPIFKQAADKYGIDEKLLKAVAKAESNFNPSVVSSAGAIGVMQLMPSTASSLGVSNPYDAKDNIMGGAKYLSRLLAKYNGNISLALAAYNAGSGNVEKYGGIPPFKETQNYVRKILGYLGSSNTDHVIYAAADKASSTGANDDSAAIVFAVAAKDAASPARIYLQ